jgi:hypothetical protein
MYRSNKIIVLHKCLRFDNFKTTHKQRVVRYVLSCVKLVMLKRLEDKILYSTR